MNIYLPTLNFRKTTIHTIFFAKYMNFYHYAFCERCKIKVGPEQDLQLGIRVQLKYALKTRLLLVTMEPPDNPSKKETCPGCGNSFKSVQTHIARSKKCNGGTPEQAQKMKDDVASNKKSAKKRIAANKS